MLLITDRRDEGLSLQRILSMWGRCDVADLNNRHQLSAQRAERLVVSDAELTDGTAVEAVRKALLQRRGVGTPHLVLLRDGSPRCAIQGNAIGATKVLSADASPEVLLKTVGDMLNLHEIGGPESACLRMRQQFIAAAAALAETLSAAASDCRLPEAAIESSVETINHAVDNADIGSWLELVWKHDDSTYQHCLLVAGLAAAFGRQLGFAAVDRRLLTGAAILHDIGKARIPLEILNKTGKLDLGEFQIMRKHPEFGHEMLIQQGYFEREVADVARSHHEYLDGSGYPDGLCGSRISDLVRMVTICDIFAALIERRSYKRPMPAATAYKLMVQMSGKLDMDLLRAFKSVALSS